MKYLGNSQRQKAIEILIPPFGSRIHNLSQSKENR